MREYPEGSADRHPDTAELDRLHAGLFDRQPAVRAALTDHLGRCDTCRARVALWPRLAAELERSEAGTAHSLALRRERALRGTPARRTRRAPTTLALAAGVAAIAVGTGVLRLERPEPASAPPAEAQAADLYVDLDFYLWLLHKQTHAGAPPNS